MGRRLGLCIVVIAVAAAIGVPSEGAALSSRTHVVRLVDIEIKPPVLRIRRGATVEWRFRDGVAAHNVTSRGTPRFRSSATKQDGIHRVRFRRRGTYRYVCTLHFSMRGRIVVR